MTPQGEGRRADVSVWRHCYEGGWQGLIVPEAYSHPAKFSRSLIQTIYQHCIAEGWLAPGDTCADPFGGVALGGLDAALAGIHWIGIELEQRFCALAHGFDCGGSAAKHEACSQTGDHDAHYVTGNLELWQRRYGHLPQWVGPTLLQGDSRQLATVLREQMTACVSSPPYAGSFHGQDEAATTDDRITRTSRDPRYGTTGRHSQINHPRGYGESPGQLGALPPGSLDAAIATPPHVHGLGKEHTYADHTKRDRDGHRAIMREKGIADPYYGSDPAQLGNLPAGSVEAVVSSPPYAAHVVGHGSCDEDDQARQRHGFATSSGDPLTAGRAKGLKAMMEGYGTTTGQLGSEHGTTFWSAAAEIVQQVFGLLKPNGIAVWVVKSYVRDGAIVDFPGQWATLCHSLGLVTLHEHHALLVEDHGTQGGLFGADTTHRTHKKSFFRRLHEKKRPDLAINYEVVLCMQKRGDAMAGSLDACVSSPPYSTLQAPICEGNVGAHPDGAHASQRRSVTGNKKGQGYGTTPGNLGNLPEGDTL